MDGFGEDCGGAVWNRGHEGQTVCERGREGPTVCDRCREGQTVCVCVRVVELERRVWQLERALIEKDDVITKLRAENRDMSAELLEVHLQKLQRAISDKDSAIAVLEHSLHETTHPSSRRRSHSPNAHSLGNKMAALEKLKKERANLTLQIKKKVRERLDLFKKDSEEALGSLSKQYQECNKKQVCDVLRALERSTMRLKRYIDQLLAVLLEQQPSLLEGLPRIQQEPGLDLDLFTVASLTELLEELRDKEKKCDGLQEYADLLLQRITEHSPDLLNSVGHLQDC